MRWDHLFDDLESQLEHELGAEEVDLFAEEERLRLGRLGLKDRLRGVMLSSKRVSPLRIVLVDGTRISITLGAVGRDWIAGEVAAGGYGPASCVIPVDAISACFPETEQVIASTDTSDDSSPATGSLASRLGLAFVLRDLCRRRTALSITTRREQLHGTLDRVARDHVDLAEHDAGVPRRDRAVRGIRLLPMSEIVVIRF
jgi:hypothetical protein